MGNEEKENLHEKHKYRLRKKFLENEYLYEHELLELVLSYCIVRGNTNDLAHRLINAFGSLHGVFEASVQDLMLIDGVGERCATFLKMQNELLRAYFESKYKPDSKVYSPDNIIPYLKGLFFGRTEEMLYLVCVDDRKRVVKVKLACRGVNSMNTDFRLIVHELLATQSTGCILAHNHPNGILKASQEDITCTQIMKKYLSRIDIELIDHFIFAENKCISIFDEPAFKLDFFGQSEPRKVY